MSTLSAYCIHWYDSFARPLSPLVRDCSVERGIRAAPCCSVLLRAAACCCGDDCVVTGWWVAGETGALFPADTRLLARPVVAVVLARPVVLHSLC